MQSRRDKALHLGQPGSISTKRDYNPKEAVFVALNQTGANLKPKLHQRLVREGQFGSNGSSLHLDNR
jgi:hypothetical protein